MRKAEKMVASYESKHDSPQKKEKITDSLLVPLGKKWHELVPLVRQTKSPQYQEEKLKQEAELLSNLDRKNYTAHKLATNKVDYNWLTSVIKSGTFSDRLSAYTLLIQESPIHNYNCILKLLEIVNPKTVRECLMTMDNLKDLFLGDLLPKRKVFTFRELLAFLPYKETFKRNQMLVLFLFEEKLLAVYQRFLDTLEKLSFDSSDAVKNKAIHLMFDVLASRAKYETTLLEKLVNKLGDPSPKRASHVGYLLGRLVNQKCPDIKELVVKEVERVLFRPNIKEKPQYYALRFMSEIVLTKLNKSLANRLIGIYFNFFDASTKKNNINNKMMNVLITGVTRAFPYSNLESEALVKRLDSFYKLIHIVDKNTAIQGLALIYNVLDLNESGLVADRFYCVLYRSLHEINIESCSRKALFLSILFKAMKRDPVKRRVKAFIKRLLQVALAQPPNISAAILVLISEILHNRPEIGLVQRQSSTQETGQSEDDDDEFYEDVNDSSEDIERDNSKEIKSSWVHQKNFQAAQRKTSHYDPNGRNPLYANAEFCDNWELTFLANHFHPSVSLFSQKISNGKLVIYDGDPLIDFTAKRFLDRFVFRNPKKVSKENASKSAKNTLFMRTSKSKTIPIDKLPFKAKHKIPLEERFIYDYLVNKKKSHKEDDNQSVTSEDFDRILEKYEPDPDESFAHELKRPRRKKVVENEESNEDEQSGGEDSDFGEEDLNIEDFDDEDFEDQNGRNILFDDDDENEDDLSRFNRRGRDKSLAKLFAAADKFSNILDGKSSFFEKDDEEDEEDGGVKSKQERKRRPKAKGFLRKGKKRKHSVRNEKKKQRK